MILSLHKEDCRRSREAALSSVLSGICVRCPFFHFFSLRIAIVFFAPLSIRS